MNNFLDDIYGTKVYQLMFVQMYEIVGTIVDSLTEMYRVKKMQCFEIIEIDSIEHEMHLISYYKNIQTWMINESSQFVLNEYEKFWMNNQIDMYIYNSIY